MSKYPDPSGSVGVRPVKALLLLADKANWSLMHLGMAVQPRFAHHVYVPSADLVLLPTARPMGTAMGMMNPVMAATRADILVIRVTNTVPRRVELAVAIWRSTERRWFVPMAPWLSDDGLWIVPDPYHPAARAECFRVGTGRLKAGPAPWKDQAEQLAGRARADAWIAPVIA